MSRVMASLLAVRPIVDIMCPMAAPGDNDANAMAFGEHVQVRTWRRTPAHRARSPRGVVVGEARTARRLRLDAAVLTTVR
jgi:hypothetical protein